MKAQDGKMRETDTLDTKGILRLIESVPSPKAEPFKLWLASLESERIDDVKQIENKEGEKMNNNDEMSSKMNINWYPRAYGKN